MYLKSIEVHGFKSFAHKLVFEFHDGITAIVGPNGSGKSNVSDAVRWVLGEQSAKQLRGAKMEDIIFSGTETRKPLGFAYVAITLDNSDHKLPIEYEEVTVARRVFRSGESEYMINGTNCRLKDVQELFLDTGIGKEGYSIIGQGQIDKILSGKPEERRELFDEAAGIVKFKKRKAAAEKNLESEKQNLYRINDILMELEKQVGPLEKQSLVAKEYLRLRDELKHLDVDMFLMEYDRIHEGKKQVDEKLHIASSDLDATKVKYERTKIEYEKLEESLEAYNLKLEDLRNLLSENKIKKEQLEGDIKVLHEQIIAAKQSDQHFQGRKNIIDKEIEMKQEELNQYIQKKDALCEQIALFDNLRSEVEDKLKVATTKIDSFTKQITDLNADIIRFLSVNSEIKTKTQHFETMLEQNNIKRVSLTQKLLKNKSDEALLNEEIEAKKDNLGEVSKQLCDKIQLNEDVNLQIAKNQELLDIEKTNQMNKQQEYHREKSKLDSLKNITERYEGYGNSIRKVMEVKDDNSGIIGVVADIIKVKKEYETAVETALGGSIQNIVTDNDTTAKNLIEYLKKNRFGRATFLPLNSITNKNAFYNEKALQEPGVIGIASSLIETDSKFSGLIDYLLGRIVVVDHIDHAIALSKKYNYSLRIVTVEGELLSPGGSMSGGAYRNTSNLLGRRREIDEIKQKIITIENELNELNAKITLLREEKAEKKEAVHETKKIIQELYLIQNTAKLQLNQTIANKEGNLVGLSEIQKESNLIDIQIKELNVKAQELKILLKENEEKSKLKEKQIEDVQVLLQQEKEEQKNASDKSAFLNVEFASIEQNNQFITENMNRIQHEIDKLKEEKGQLESNLTNATTQVNEKETAIQRTKEEMLSFEVCIQEINKNIEVIHTEKEKISQEHKSFFSKREELSSRMNELDKEIFRLTNQLEKLTEQLDFQINYMWEEYELTYSSAQPLKTEEEYSLSQIKKLSLDQKAKIKNLGDVNVNAIEDYKNLVERYQLLKTQRDDLVKAEEVLLGIIEELDTAMRKQFAEKFTAIKAQFDVVFKELFGGGKGTLELIEDEDILEAGIRIIAQPPGKKLQNMMQLSGGEKALTAISLLFAILNLKPSPFCLLDEIEAALDDSNVKRYAQYLHKLTKNTQFIVITHRRGTMAAANILYGITMQEKGVSTLVSVNLIENELDK